MRSHRVRVLGLALSLLVCAAIGAIGVRSLAWADLLTFRIGHHILSTKSVAGSVSFQSLYVSGAAIQQFIAYPQPFYDNYVRVENSGGWWRREWFTGYSSRTKLDEFNPAELMRATHFTVPHWLLMLPFIATSAWFATRLQRERRYALRITRGQCPLCGYDIRATPERCPECFEPIPTIAAMGVPTVSAKK